MSLRPRAALRASISLAVTTALLTTAAVASAAPATAADDHCIPVAVIAFRGSGQTNIDPNVTAPEGAPHVYGTSRLQTNGWEGNTLKLLLDRVAVSTGVTGLRGEDIPVYAIGPGASDTDKGYPALDAIWEALGQLSDSASRGAVAAHDVIAEVKKDRGSPAAGCASTTEFIVLGYSQGAMAARYTALTNRDDVIGYLAVGDPLQKPGGAGVFGGGNGIGVIHVTSALRVATGKFDDVVRSIYSNDIYDLPITRHGLCHSGDPICDLSPIYASPLALFMLGRLSAAPHMNYFERDAEALDFAARYIAAAEPSVAPRRLDRRPVDIAVVVDASPSMKSRIPKLSAVKRAAMEEKIRGMKLRVSLIDFTEDDEARVILPLTDDLDLFDAAVEELEAASGDDSGTAAVHAGIEAAATELDWAPATSRAILAIGDSAAASTHDDDALLELLSTAVTGASAASTGTEDGIEEVEPIVVYGLSAHDDFGDALDRLVTATGGLLLEHPDEDALHDAAVLEILRDAQTAPNAQLGALSVVAAGLPMPVTATGSIIDDPDLTYAFDLDGDGVFEVSDDHALVMTPTTPGDLRISLRVTDSRGRVSQETRTVTVTEPLSDGMIVDESTPRLTVTAPASARAGSTVAIGTGLPQGSPVAIGLVPGDGSPWGGALAHLVEGEVDATGSLAVEVPAALGAGAYQALVVAEDEAGVTWGSAPLSVTAAASSSTPSPSATPAAGSAALAATGGSGELGAFLAAAAALLVAAGAFVLALTGRRRARAAR